MVEQAMNAFLLKHNGNLHERIRRHEAAATSALGVLEEIAKHGLTDFARLALPDALEQLRAALKPQPESAQAQKAGIELIGLRTPRRLDEWHEEHSDVLWWKFPIDEPPYCGTPLDGNWPEYHTHWTPLLIPNEPQAESAQQGKPPGQVEDGYRVHYTHEGLALNEDFLTLEGALARVRGLGCQGISASWYAFKLATPVRVNEDRRATHNGQPIPETMDWQDYEKERSIRDV